MDKDYSTTKLRGKHWHEGLPKLRDYGGKDIDVLLLLFAAADTIDKAIVRMPERLAAVPGGMQGMRMILGRLDQIIMDCVGTLDENKRDNLLHNAFALRYKIYVNAATKTDKDYTVISMSDMNAFFALAHEHCMMCIDGKCDACPVGKLLDRTMTHERAKGERWGEWEGWHE